MEGGSIVTVLLPLTLFIIMFGMGLSLHKREFYSLIDNPGVIAVGLALQLVLLPLLAVTVISIMQLPATLAVGILILSFAPGGATSNMISYLCRADTALSISLTLIASLIIPFTSPWLTYLSMQHFMGSGVLIEFPLASAILKLLTVTVVPVLCGLWIRSRWQALCQRLEQPVKWFSLLFMLFVVVMITGANYERMPQLIKQLGPAVLLLASSAMLLAYLISRYLFGYRSKIALTLCIETGVQNAGTALMVTGAILHNTEMSMSALLYGILMQLPALLLILYRNLNFKVGSRAASE